VHLWATKEWPQGHWSITANGKGQHVEATFGNVCNYKDKGDNAVALL
jgi:hypothetical protein